ncbi:MAG: S8 family serine peptidase [Burkholderiales bacterium]
MQSAIRTLIAGLALGIGLHHHAIAAEVFTSDRAVPNRYIVVLHDDAMRTMAMSQRSAHVSATADEMGRRHGLRTEHIYRHVLPGFVATMDAAKARALARDPRVKFIEQDAIMSISAVQNGATWGLDRIDQRDLPIDTRYNYAQSGRGVHAYVIDTGIRGTHSEFAGRLEAGTSTINDGRGAEDCNGHGTHVAGTIGGTIFGVAKSVTLVPVRVLDCNGSGSTSGVLEGVDWVTQNHKKPAVANMSLGGSISTALDMAVEKSIAAGVTYALAAGNANANACNSSPSRVSQALTVGATTSADARSSFSNIGSCLDLFAPGSTITSAWITSDTATRAISGTSMASPHVAGAVALELEKNPNFTPAQVAAAIVNNATTGKIASIGTGSPNRLLHTAAGTPGDPVPVAAFTFNCTTLACSFDGSGSTDNVSPLASFAWNFGDGTTATGSTPSKTFASAGTFAVILTVTDSVGQTDTETKSVTVTSPSADPCTGCARFTGSLSGAGETGYQPNGTWYQTGVSGTHRAWLRGPAGTNFDLYLYRWSGTQWTIVARAEGATSEETISYNGTPGYYVFAVYARQGAGQYEFWLQRP